MLKGPCGFALLMFVLFASPSTSWGQTPGTSDPDASIAATRKAIQNPVSNLIIVYLQNNFDLKIGQYDRTRFLVNAQPVVPFRLSEGWTLTTRTWIPLGYQPVTSTPAAGVTGLGDIQPSFLFAPAVPGKVIWGVGPTVLLPTATDRSLATGKFSAGPALLVLVQPTHWSIGAFVTNLYSIAGPSTRRDLDLLSIQIYMNDNLAKGWYLLSNPSLYADHKVSTGHAWTIPVGGGVGRVLKIGPQTINSQLSAYRNVVHTSQGAHWQLRAQLALVYPQGQKGK